MNVKLKTVDGWEDREFYSVDDFPYYRIDNRIVDDGKKSYFQAFGAFDIETTTIENIEHEYGFMYIWQMCFDDILVCGRRWNEFEKFILNITHELGADDKTKIVIYVHNLSYEYQFMKSFCQRSFGNEKLFATQKRRVLYVSYDCGVEFRCSYKLTNMALDRAVRNERGVKFVKSVGDLDYRVLRTPDTPLTESEMGYIFGDVQSLYGMIKNRLRNDGDTLCTIPLTSTGYVRRYCRNVVRKTNPDYHTELCKSAMSETVYKLMLECGRGGDTHANRMFSGRVVHDVDAFDVVSSYPAQMLMQKFPARKFIYYGNVDSRAELETIIAGHPAVFRIILCDVELNTDIAMPYISLSKCLMINHYVNDNGRILRADAIALTLTDIDYRLIKRQYTFDVHAVSMLYISDYDYLPWGLRTAILELFRKKTELKNVDAYLYGKSKNRLNGVFGMAYTKPVHDDIIIRDGKWAAVKTNDIAAELEKYYKNRNNFLQYYNGVWTTAYAREWLADLIELTGQTCTIYCDTDSSYAINVDMAKIEKRNDEIRKMAYERGAYVEIDGVKHFLGIYEHETKNGKYKQFKTLGAKKYCTVDKNGKFSLTIAGVNKKLGAAEMGTIDNFEIGYIFRMAGGLELKYNDDCEIVVLNVNGCEFETSSNIAMMPSTYTLGITNEYAEILGINVYKN